ncbi:MAG: prepilin peptidase [Pseudomonadota bacterium]
MSEHQLLTLFSFIFGSIWGSFANVVIVRLPQNQSVVLPKSHCPKCKYQIPWYFNVPIFAWLFLQGKCRNCKTPISVRYPIVEALMGLVFAAFYYRYGWSISTLEYWLFGFGLVSSSFIDIDHMILPDRFTLSGIVLGLVGSLINPDRAFMDAFLGFFIGGGLLYAVAVLYSKLRNIEAMGGGDIKLLGWIGAICGIQSIPFVLLSSSFIGLFFGVFYMMASRQGLKTAVPFGPYLSLGALLFLLVDSRGFMSLFFNPFV